MTSGTLGHSFEVNSAHTTISVDTFLNIIKRRADIQYRSYVPPHAANIGYIRTSPLESSRCVSISDKSTFLAANRIHTSGYVTIAGQKTFTAETDELAITDIFVQPQSSTTPVPLFYKHVISTANLPRVSSEDFTIQSGYRVVNIQFLDLYMQPIKVAAQVQDADLGIIYNNLTSSYKNQNDYDFYYLRYTVITPTESITYTDLLDNILVYREATFDDLDLSLQIKTDGRKVYTIEETISGYNITLPIVGTYSYRVQTLSRIQLLKPSANDSDDPWYLRVTNGTFWTTVNSELYKYHIAEFLSQSFFPEPPIKKASYETARILDRVTVKLDHDNIYQDSANLIYLDLILNDKDDEGLYALTTNPSLEDTIAINGAQYKLWNNVSRLGIRSIDHRSSLINIEGIVLNSDWKVYATYSYKENQYEVTTIDCNPLNNPSILETRVVFFISPDTSSTSQEQTLFYLKVDQTGKVFESNWPYFDNTNQLYALEEYGIGTIELYYELRPNWIVSVLPYRIFTTEDTVQGNGVLLLLGDITVSSGSGVDSLQFLDSRVRGGGLFLSRLEEVLGKFPSAMWCWDIGYWDGIPFPGKGSYVVEVPVDLLDGAGGSFTQQEVRDIINRHTAAGVYAVGRAYGADFSISGIYTGQDFLTLEWQGYGY